MSTIKKNIDNITRTKTALDGSERLAGRDATGDFKITAANISSSAQSITTVGLQVITLKRYKAISDTFPWFCLGLPDQDLVQDTETGGNFPEALITEMRSWKVTYDEFDTAQTEFVGAWVAGVYTLTDTTANNEMIALLEEDYNFQGDFTKFRILSDGTNEYEITALDSTARTITVDTTDNTPSGTAVEIYLHRLYGETTSVRHYSEAGLANYQAGDGKIAGLRHRDQMQLITGTLDPFINTAASGVNTATGVFDSNGDTAGHKWSNLTSGSETISFDSSGSPGARTSDDTDGETIARHISEYKYLYVGSYTA